MAVSASKAVVWRGVLVLAIATGVDAVDADTAIAALDENPDLYLWLASNDDAVPSLEP